MKTLFHAIAVAAVAGLSIAPTLASAEMKDYKTMTCKEFSAMDATGMQTAMQEMHKASADGANEMTAAQMDKATKSTMAACKAKPDATAMDAMMMK